MPNPAPVCRCGHRKIAHSAGRKEHDCWHPIEPDNKGFGIMLCECKRYQPRMTTSPRAAYRAKLRVLWSTTPRRT